MTITEPTFVDGGKLVTAWRWTPWCVYGGWRVCRARWVWDPREGWDQEQAEWAHAHPFDTQDRAQAVANALNDHPDHA